jgi:hypothetical protein
MILMDSLGPERRKMVNQQECIRERDRHWRTLLQYDDNPATAGLNILERVRRLSQLLGFVNDSPTWRAVLGHLVAVAETEHERTLQAYNRYAFLRDSTCVVAQWEPDSRHRIYLAGDPCTMLVGKGQKEGFDTADDAVDAAIEMEETI